MELEMVETLVARVSLSINAPRATVWDALVDPEKIKQYIFVTEVVSEWREGSSIVWKSEYQNKNLEIRGTILRLESQRVARVRPVPSDLSLLQSYSFAGGLPPRDHRAFRRGRANAPLAHRTRQHDRTRARALRGRLANGARQHEGIAGRYVSRADALSRGALPSPRDTTMIAGTFGFGEDHVALVRRVISGKHVAIAVVAFLLGGTTTVIAAPDLPVIQLVRLVDRSNGTQMAAVGADGSLAVRITGNPTIEPVNLAA